MIAIELGAMLMALGAQNRADSDRDNRRLGFIFVLSAAVIILMIAIMITEDALLQQRCMGRAFTVRPD